MDSKWLLDNFNIELQKTDEGVLIRAEDQSQELLYSKLLNYESVKQLSIDQFLDLETLYQLLKDFFEKEPDNTSLSISNSGNLHYSCQVLFGSVVKKFEFNIPLEKQELDPLTKLENQVNRISAKIQRLEDERNVPIKAFHDFQRVIFAKLDKFEEILAQTEARVARLEENLPIETLKCQFNLTPELQYKFQVTNEGKTASTLVYTTTSIFAKQSLPKGKKSKFSFLIGKTIWLMVGITIENPLNRDLAYKHPAAFAYSFDGKFYLDGEPQGSYSKYDQNDRVSFVCDMGTGKIEVFLNDNFVGHHEISKQHLEADTFYPFIYANRDLGVGATFIET